MSEEDWKQIAAEKNAEIRQLRQQNAFMGRQLSFMIPKVRAGEQIALDEFEIGIVIAWHTDMVVKCERNKLDDRARYHRERAQRLQAVIDAAA